MPARTEYAFETAIEAEPFAPRDAECLELHRVNIEQIIRVIIKHFRLQVMHELGGRAKTMVVTGSRLAAVRYKRAFDRYIKDQKYSGIRSLVAFSGSV